MDEILKNWLNKHLYKIVMGIITLGAAWAIPNILTTYKSLTTEKRVDELIDKKIAPLEARVKASELVGITNEKNIVILQTQLNKTVEGMKNDITSIKTDVAYIRGRESNRKK